MLAGVVLPQGVCAYQGGPQQRCFTTLSTHYRLEKKRAHSNASVTWHVSPGTVLESCQGVSMPGMHQSAIHATQCIWIWSLGTSVTAGSHQPAGTHVSAVPNNLPVKPVHNKILNVRLLCTSGRPQSTW